MIELVTLGSRRKEPQREPSQLNGGKAMNSIFRNLTVAVSVLLMSFVVVSAQTQPERPQETSDKKSKEKEPKEKKGGFLGIGGGNKEEKAEKAAAKVEREYQKLLENGRKKYDAKPDFKIRVDEDYKAVRRRHSEAAFQINTFDSQDERTTFTGDKLKTEDTLYDNPLVQDYVNRVGQSLVPADSQHRYAFKVIMNPVPDARSLSTGTIYITTGLLSMVDNEAQLAYLLSHEISHIEKRHWFQDALVANEMEDFNQSQERKQGLFTLGATLAGGVIGGAATGRLASGLSYGFLAGLGTAIVMKFVAPTKVFAWDRVQENEADEYGLQLMFNRNYDPREVPKLFARLRRFAEREPRASEGFLAQAERINERVSYFNPMLAQQTVKTSLFRGSSNLRDKREASDGGLASPLEVGKPFGAAEEAEKREKAAAGRLSGLDALLKEKLERGEIVGSTAEFESVMADLKRDNGVRAFYYDMFQMSLENLREALQIRSNDPYTHFYYGKVLNLTARNRAEKAEAMSSFIKAIEYDQRGVLSGPWLHRALALIADRNPSQSGEIIGYLKRYVDVYQQEHRGELPPNMDAIYAYMKDLGEDRWVARPAMNISTKNIEPIETSAGARLNVNQPPPQQQQPQPQPQQPTTQKTRKP
jgi:predicted Zn-dependent protease